jgi:hypothetical protein
MKYGLRSLFVAALIAFAAIGGQALLSFATVSSASADELLPGLTPSLRPIAYSGDNGYTVQVTNYDAAYSYSFSVTQGTYTYRYAGSPVSLTLAIRNIPLGESSTLTVSTSRTGYADASNSIVVYAKKPALTPTFGAPVPTYGEYSVQITNYDPAFTWRASSVKGSASIDANGLVSVTNLGANLDDTLVVTTTRTDYVGGTAQVAATAWPLQTALTPQFGTVNEYVGGFDFQITNYDPAFTWQIWSLDGNGGDFNIGSDGLVTILNSTPGVSKAVSVYAIRSGFETGRADITGIPIGAGLTPELANYRSTANGFTVEITNFDSNFNWSFETELGSAWMPTDGLIEVDDLNVGEGTFLLVHATRDGYESTTTPFYGVALSAGLVATFGNIQQIAGGFSTQITNFNSSFTWVVSSTVGTASISDSGLLTVSGLNPGDTADVTIASSADGYLDAITTYRGVADNTALTPLFSAVSRFEGGFSSRLLNFDRTFAWHAQVTAGQVSLDESGNVLVSGLSAGQSATLTVSNSRQFYAVGSGFIVGSALDAQPATPSSGSNTVDTTDSTDTSDATNAAAKAKARAEAEAAAEATAKAKAEADAVIRAKEETAAHAAAEKAAKLEADRKAVAEALAKPRVSTRSVIKSLTAEQVALIAPAVIRQLAPATVAAITAKQAACLTASQVRALPVSSLTKLKPAVIGALRPEALAALPVAKLKALTKAQVRQIWLGQWLQLDIDQRKAIRR